MCYISRCPKRHSGRFCVPGFTLALLPAARPWHGLHYAAISFPSLLALSLRFTAYHKGRQAPQLRPYAPSTSRTMSP
jgi:hypothetical protein